MIEYFQWDEDFVSGNPSKDKQHYGLVESINELVSVSLNPEGIEPDQLARLKVKLTHYVDVHFKTEEKLMEDHKLDPQHIQDHKKLHRDFVDETVRFFDSFLNKEGFVEYHMRWLAYHILNTD